MRPRKNILSDERGRKGFRREKISRQPRSDVKRKGKSVDTHTRVATAAVAKYGHTEITSARRAPSQDNYCLRTRTPFLCRLAERTKNRSAPKPTPTLRRNNKSTATKSYYEWVTPSALDQTAQIRLHPIADQARRRTPKGVHERRPRRPQPLKSTRDLKKPRKNEES